MFLILVKFKKYLTYLASYLYKRKMIPTKEEVKVKSTPPSDIFNKKNETAVNLIR